MEVLADSVEQASARAAETLAGKSAQLKAMIESAQKLVCLTIAEKINSQQPIQVCEAQKIHTLITELPADEPILEPYIRAGIKVL